MVERRIFLIGVGVLLSGGIDAFSHIATAHADGGGEDALAAEDISQDQVLGSEGTDQAWIEPQAEQTQTVKEIVYFNPPTPEQKAVIKKIIWDKCTEAGVDVVHFTNVIQRESEFNPYARNESGAEGLAQFMPGTWDYIQTKFFPERILNKFDPSDHMDAAIVLQKTQGWVPWGEWR